MRSPRERHFETGRKCGWPKEGFRDKDTALVNVRFNDLKSGHDAHNRGRPGTIRCDDGPAFAGRALAHWACLDGVEPDSWSSDEEVNARKSHETLIKNWGRPPPSTR
jgi:hypothetical protein